MMWVTSGTMKGHMPGMDVLCSGHAACESQDQDMIVGGYMHYTLDVQGEHTMRFIGCILK
jgi:hypothetical protein